MLTAKEEEIKKLEENLKRAEKQLKIQTQVGDVSFYLCHLYIQLAWL